MEVVTEIGRWAVWLQTDPTIQGWRTVTALAVGALGLVFAAWIQWGLHKSNQELEQYIVSKRQKRVK